MGNVEDVANSAIPNDVYMNLRLKVDSGTNVTLGTNDFSVDIPDDGFYNINEEVQTNVEAWNIKY